MQRTTGVDGGAAPRGGAVGAWRIEAGARDRASESITVRRTGSNALRSRSTRAAHPRRGACRV